MEIHRAQLMERLDSHDIAGLARFAIRTELISVDEGAGRLGNQVTGLFGWWVTRAACGALASC